jgi:hypothetical protein
MVPHSRRSLPTSARKCVQKSPIGVSPVAIGGGSPIGVTPSLLASAMKNEFTLRPRSAVRPPAGDPKLSGRSLWVGWFQEGKSPPRRCPNVRRTSIVSSSDPPAHHIDGTVTFEGVRRDAGRIQVDVGSTRTLGDLRWGHTFAPRFCAGKRRCDPSFVPAPPEEDRFAEEPFFSASPRLRVNRFPEIARRSPGSAVKSLRGVGGSSQR